MNIRGIKPAKPAQIEMGAQEKLTLFIFFKFWFAGLMG